MHKKFMVFLLLALVALASACTGSKSSAYSQTEGLVITKFIPIPSKIYNGEQVTLDLGVLNKGGPDVAARNVRAFVLNFDTGGWSVAQGDSSIIRASGSSTTPTTTTTTTPTTTPASQKVSAGTNLPVDVYISSYFGRRSIQFYYGTALQNNTANQNVTDCPESTNEKCTAELKMPLEDKTLRVVVKRYQADAPDTMGAPVADLSTTLDVVPSSESGQVTRIVLREQPATATAPATTPAPTPTSADASILSWKPNPSDVFGSSKDGTVKALPDGTTWVLTASDKTARNLDVTFNPKVRVCYDYQTEATTKAQVIQLSELRAEQQKGTVTEADISTLNSGGPIQMQITTRQPIILRDAQTGQLKMSVDVLNVDPRAGGLAYLPALTADGREVEDCLQPVKKNKVILAAQIVGATCTVPPTQQVPVTNLPAKVQSFYTRNGIPMDGTACLMEVNLADGKKGIANYQFNLNGATVGVKELNIRLIAFYSYYTEAQTQFTVQPQPQ